MRLQHLKWAILFLWELPQNLLGLALWALEHAVDGAHPREFDKERIFLRSKRNAVSLGLFVFWAEGTNRYAVLDHHTRAHEYGHTFQSRWFGPLYLPLIGVPSVMRVLYSILYREVTGKRWTHYFDGYPENWADRLGGVVRTKEQP
jgi:hypothetical protein